MDPQLATFIALMVAVGAGAALGMDRASRAQREEARVLRGELRRLAEAVASMRPEVPAPRPARAIPASWGEAGARAAKADGWASHPAG